MSRRIALVFDCDGTIAEDTTTRLLTHVGLNPNGFWANVRSMEKQGWEPTLAFMKLLVDFAQKNKPKIRINKLMFQEVARSLKLSKGIPSFFREIKEYIARKYGKEGISLGIYIVSGGVAEMIRASEINGRYSRGAFVDDIYGCHFAYDTYGIICFPKTAVTFTEKTKFIFAINKGISSKRIAQDPYSVNDDVPPHEREIPLENMIYIGDGPTDVACMSLLRRAKCEIFAVYTEPRYGIPKTTYALASQGRLTRGPYKRDYTTGSDLRRALEGELNGYAERVLSEIRLKRRPAVRHG